MWYIKCISNTPTKKLSRKEIKNKIDLDAQKIAKPSELSKNVLKILTSFLFWAEGAKTTSFIAFINSDPAMIELFLKLLRNCYLLDESKFRITIHAHEYHDKRALKVFWSETTGIPESQFTKIYEKPNTGKRKRQGYKGSIRIRYYDYRIAWELKAVYNAFAENYINT